MDIPHAIRIILYPISYYEQYHVLKLLWTTYVCHISFQSTQMGNYRHQVLYMFLLHKMVHIQLKCACKSTNETL